MADQPTVPPAQSGPGAPIFHEPPRERSFPTTPVVLAAVAVIVIIAVLVVVGRHSSAPAPTTEQPVAAYASSLEISNVQMSQSESLSGGRSTYLDGHIANHGNQTVTGVTIQALFANEAGQPPQILTVPLSVIRTRQPYVDTQPLSLAPLAPGKETDFRLIFEGVNDSWDQKPPALRIIQVGVR